MATYGETKRSEMRTISSNEIAQRAYELFEMRGREVGHDLDDWLRAEQELRGGRRNTSADWRRRVETEE